MARFLVMYKTPADPAAFDKHYAEKHIPLAKKIPGIRKFEISKGAVGTPGGPSPYHRVAIVEFDSLAALQAAIISPQGQATAADAMAIATGGVDIYLFESGEA